jgi:hypothetical protein
VGIVHQTLALRGRTVDVLANEPLPAGRQRRTSPVTLPVTLPVTVPEVELAAVMSRVTELEARVTSLEARDVTKRHAHVERQRRYRERKKQSPGP